MKRYGVKLNNGKVVWVLADGVRVENGAVLFLRQSDGAEEVAAGFSLAQLNHFGVPDAFASVDEK